MNQGLHSQFATGEQGHRSLEFVRPGYSQKHVVSGRALIKCHSTIGASWTPAERESHEAARRV